VTKKPAYEAMGKHYLKFSSILLAFRARTNEMKFVVTLEIPRKVHIRRAQSGG